MRGLRVLFDGEGFLSPFGGVPQAFAEMICRLPEGIEPILAMKRTCNRRLQTAPFCIPGYPDQYHSFISPAEFRGKWRLWRLAQKLFPKRFPDYEAENSRYLDELLEKGEFDVLHLTGAHVYGEAWRKVVGKKPIVITVHDLIPEILNHDARITAFRRELLGVADQVIAVSENTKRDLMRLYGVDEKKVTVVYHGVGKVERVERVEGVEKEYFLFLGGRSGYKNWDWMVRAMAPMLKGGMNLVCTGHPFSGEERRFLRSLGVEERVVQRTVCADDFPALYASATAFVYPSRYEGFGLPILDAWAAGCPVVLSRASCFPEIGGDAAEYFELDDAKSLVAAIERAKEGRTVEKGRQRLKDFSWKKCAAKTAAVYRKVAG